MAKKSKVVMIECSGCKSAVKVDDSLHCKLRMNSGRSTAYTKVTRVCSCSWYRIKLE